MYAYTYAYIHTYMDPTHIPHTKPIKPIIKWVGGKTQILDTLFANFPTKMKNYHEIFMGGGSVLLTLLAQINSGAIQVTGTIHAYDINEPLIHMYKNIQQKHRELHTILETIIRELNACPDEGVVNRKSTTIEDATQTKENYYYWCRNRYNQLSEIDQCAPLGSALFIFLNKTCFRGVFRVGPNGFNVPYGHYKTPEIINYGHLEEMHHLIQKVQFECLDFAESMARVKSGDFAYLDPPYAPETTTSFVGYTKLGFGLDKHQQLFELVHSKKKAKLMMSNADVELVRANFPEDTYTIQTISCKRSINSKNPESKTNEVIITNYE